MGLTEFLVNLILGFTVFYVLRGFIFRLLMSGRLTGNEYRRGPEGKLWVKHPGGGWVRLDIHEKEQKRLRENR